MTAENRRKNIELELRMAPARCSRHNCCWTTECTRMLFPEHTTPCRSRSGVAPDGVDRAEAHKGIGFEIYKRFVRAGQLTADEAEMLSSVEAQRSTADYNREAEFTAHSAARAVGDARRFSVRCLEILKQLKYVD